MRFGRNRFGPGDFRVIPVVVRNGGWGAVCYWEGPEGARYFY